MHSEHGPVGDRRILVNALRAARAEIATLTDERDRWHRVYLFEQNTCVGLRVTATDFEREAKRYRGELEIAKAEIAALTEQRDGYKRDYEDTRDCLNNERRIWTRINAGGATFAAERDEARAAVVALTEHNRALAVVIEAARAYREAETDGTPRMYRGKALQDLANALDDTLAALDTPSSPSLPETP
jgi:hypothetical protein